MANHSVLYPHAYCPDLTGEVLSAILLSVDPGNEQVQTTARPDTKLHVRRYDPTLPTRIHVEAAIDAQRICEEAGVEKESVTVSLICLCSGSMAKWDGGWQALKSTMAFDVKIPPGKWHETASLTLEAVSTAPSAYGTMSYPLPAVVWRKRVTTLVTSGHVGHFPIREYEDPYRNWQWYLEWHQWEWTSPVRECIALAINSADEDFVELISQRLATPEGRIVASDLEWEIARALLMAGSVDVEFRDNVGSFPPGSLGDTVERLMNVTQLDSRQPRGEHGRLSEMEWKSIQHTFVPYRSRRRT